MCEPVGSHRTGHEKSPELTFETFQGAQWDSFASLKRLRRLLSLRSSDFVDYEPVGSHRTGHEKSPELTFETFQGAQWDSNPRHSEPQSDALTN